MQEEQAAALEPSQALWRTLLIGFSAGILNGLMGIGGGIVIVPGVIFLLKASARVAVSTSLGTVLVLAWVAFLAHVAISGLHYSLQGAGALLAAGLVAANLGGRMINVIPAKWILLLFGCLAYFSSGNLIMQGLGLYEVDPGAVVGEPPLYGYILIGAVAGFFSGMLGIGGGGLVVLAFSVIYHRPVLEGLPLALMVNIVNATGGVVGQWGTGNILWREVMRMVPSALAGVGVGVLLAVWLPGDAFKVLFAAFFLFMGTRVLMRGLKG